MKCQACGGRGFIFKEDPESKEMMAHPCECRLEHDAVNEMNLKLIKARIPKMYWNCTFEKCRGLPLGNSEVMAFNKNTFDAMENFVNDPLKFLKSKGKILWLWNKQPGSCLTTLSVVFVAALLKLNFAVRFISMEKLMEGFTDFDNKTEFFKELDEASIYLLDDAFDSTRCNTGGEYTRIQLFHWFKDKLSRGNFFICVSNNSTIEIDAAFKQCHHLIRRESISLELKGTL